MALMSTSDVCDVRPTASPDGLPSALPPAVTRPSRSGGWACRASLLHVGRTTEAFVDRIRKEIEDAPDVTRAEMRAARFQDRLSGYYHGLYDTGL